MTPPKLTILTGSSRGMGAAIAMQCVQAGDQLIGIARGTNPALAGAAPERVQQWQTDLADATAVCDRLTAWLSAADAGAWSEVRLINNAGVIAPLRALRDIPLAETVTALRVGLEATMLVTTAFLAATDGWTVPRKVLNVSSGLGRRAMAGSASYCAAKAGMDHFSRCVALEEAERPNGARIVSLAPGVIDTDMQTQLRGADPAAFPDHDRFMQLKAQGMLDTPDQAAGKILRFLARDDFGQNVTADVREA